MRSAKPMGDLELVWARIYLEICMDTYRRDLGHGPQGLVLSSWRDDLSHQIVESGPGRDRERLVDGRRVARDDDRS